MFNFNCIYLNCAVSFVFSFIATFIGLKYWIQYLKQHAAFQPIREEGVESHVITKQKTPTMGGLVFTSVIILSGLLFCDLRDYYIVSILLLILSYSIIGLIDDMIKVFFKNTKGFKGSVRLILQILIAGGVLLFWSYNNSPATSYDYTYLPFFKYPLYLGILLIPLLIFVIVGSANSVNLTDGLDGLLTIPVIIAASVFGVLCLLNGTNQDYFPVINSDNLSNISILCFSVVGASIAYFCYNKHPAKIFMGDCGSLMYGSFLGIVAVALRYEMFYAIMGLLFIFEALSVILQVGSYKLFQRRIFKMAPIHHHFEKLGFTEQQVVFSFWTFFVICTIIAILGMINF